MNKDKLLDLQLICCPMGRPKTEVELGSVNVNFATLWLSCARLISLNSLKFSGSKQPECMNHIVRKKTYENELLNTNDRRCSNVSSQ